MNINVFLHTESDFENNVHERSDTEGSVSSVDPEISELQRLYGPRKYKPMIADCMSCAQENVCHEYSNGTTFYRYYQTMTLQHATRFESALQHVE